MKIKNLKKGFTLIELLIVIAIIGVLATLLMANFIGVRQRARDAQRKSDLRQIQSALEMYRSDNGSYPLTANFPSCGSAFTYNGNTYMSKVPCDPMSSGTNLINYTYTSAAGSTYSITACLENTNDSQATGGSCTINGATGVQFTVNNP